MIRKKLLKFAIVGGGGFIVDSLVFALAIYLLHTNLLFARVISFIFAATTTWMGNRLFTFSERRREAISTQWSKSFCSALISAIPNFLVFQASLLMLGNKGVFPFIALVLGVGAGMFSNFALSHFWVFNRRNTLSEHP
ncbi:GtrA family protein [Vibrio sp. S4M6]|uniref:GtrA family protein n=1 Tax=Vibrio sinus TaxID=2946865 RepID=UPI002029FF77|nr:GtrA family protein [Vibrio sinus]MCL9782734.1 GtrA family protein [Vibrio sinus]